MNTARLRAARNSALAAERAYHEELKRSCPLGSEICYEKSAGVVVAGVVIGHGYGEKVKVRATLSGREYWVSAYSILKAVAGCARCREEPRSTGCPFCGCLESLAMLDSPPTVQCVKCGRSRPA